MAGEVASLLLSRATVPVLYYLSERQRHHKTDLVVPTINESAVEPALV